MSSPHGSARRRVGCRAIGAVLASFAVDSCFERPRVGGWQGQCRSENHGIWTETTILINLLLPTRGISALKTSVQLEVIAFLPFDHQQSTATLGRTETAHEKAFCVNSFFFFFRFFVVSAEVQFAHWSFVGHEPNPWSQSRRCARRASDLDLELMLTSPAGSGLSRYKGSGAWFRVCAKSEKSRN